MTLCEFIEDVLIKACPNVYHDKAFKEHEEYIVWTATGKKTLRADNRQVDAAGLYMIDIYTQKEFTSIPVRLEELMDKYDEIAYSDPACNYDETTEYTHYVYSVEVI